MGNDPSNQLDRLRARIEKSDDMSDEDRAAALEFDDRLTLLRSEYSTYRHLKLLRHVTIMAEQTAEEVVNGQVYRSI